MTVCCVAGSDGCEPTVSSEDCGLITRYAQTEIAALSIPAVVCDDWNGAFFGCSRDRFNLQWIQWLLCCVTVINVTCNTLQAADISEVSSSSTAESFTHTYEHTRMVILPNSGYTKVEKRRVTKSEKNFTENRHQLRIGSSFVFVEIRWKMSSFVVQMDVSCDESNACCLLTVGVNGWAFWS